jgi:predicted RNA-binding Zn ribbon-like protein
VAGSTSLEFAACALDDEGALAESLLKLDVLSIAPAVRPGELHDARTLRDTLRRLFAAAAQSGPLDRRDVETLNSYAADEPPIVALTPGGTLFRAANDPVRCALAALARDAAAVIGRCGRDLRQCERCGDVFLDRSRGRRRRWCSMQRCGNRTKVALYRARQR